MIPPLRQRIDDIPALISHFVERKSRELEIEQQPKFAREIVENLQSYHWPGNVRELENFVERALIQSTTGKRVEEMRFKGPVAVNAGLSEGASRKTKNPILPLDEATAIHIKKTLAETNGRVEGKNGAARLLGLHPSTLRGRMRKLGIPHGKGGKYP